MLIHKILLKNVLSFGDDTQPVELRPLNVLIGPNGSGKSNLIECMGVIQALPKDLPRAIDSISDFLWKGAPQPTAAMALWMESPHAALPIRHQITFTERGGRLELVNEVIDDASESDKYYAYNGASALVLAASSNQQNHLLPRQISTLNPDKILKNQSIIQQRKDPELYPELTYLDANYSAIKIYREWNFGRNSAPRKAQKTDLHRLLLQEDASNLALVFSYLNTHASGFRQRMLELLERLDEGITNFSVDLVGTNEMQVFLSYDGLSQPIPASRLSDGTLRYLCLLAILCHPNPPPVVCIEEPETGLHPDIIPIIAELLIDASTRCQLIVTTHSHALVDALSETPESVLICEKEHGATTLRRLEQDQLTEWLAKYSLGQLWSMGELGGNRW
jgi:predicted ATPase